MPQSQAFLRTENLWFGYQSGTWTLKDISLDILPGTLNMVMGASGSGKTTLLKILGGFLTQQKGKVFLFGTEIRNGRADKLRPKIGYIPQQLGLVRNLTVLENVLMGSLSRVKGPGPLFGIFPAAEVTLAKSLLSQLGVAQKADEKVYRLSGGERQRTAIARTLMQKPAIILADEFVSDLDYKTAMEILLFVRAISQKDGVTFLMNMHETRLVKELDGRVMLIKEGRVAGEFPGREINVSEVEAAIR